MKLSYKAETWIAIGVILGYTALYGALAYIGSNRF